MRDPGPGEEDAGLMCTHARKSTIEPGMLDRLHHGNAEIFPVEWIGKQGMSTVTDRPEKPAMDGDDGRRAARHRLDGGHAEGFVAARQYKKIGSPVVIG